MTELASFKNVYVINMNEVTNRPFDCLIDGKVLLPIETKNGATFKLEEGQMPVLFSEHFARKMVKQFPDLSKILNDPDARTIIEYLDNNGKQIMTLYPTNDVDLHTRNWGKFDPNILPDVQKIVDARKELIGKAANHKEKQS